LWVHTTSPFSEASPNPGRTKVTDPTSILDLMGLGVAADACMFTIEDGYVEKCGRGWPFGIAGEFF